MRREEQFVDLPPTKEWLKLNMPPTDEEPIRLVYRRIEGSDVYYSEDIYDPANEYDDECLILPLHGVYDGSENWGPGTIFCNVLGSSGDHPIDDCKNTTWHQIFKTLGVPWECMAEEGTYYDCANGQCLEFGCNDSTCGGHVLKGETSPRTVEPNDTTQIYIIPICHRHNSIKYPIYVDNARCFPYL